MRSRRRLALPPPLLVAAWIALAGLAAPAAEAAKAPCLPDQAQPKCKAWKAKIVSVTDGDTVTAKVKQRGGWSKPTRIGLVGVQAMELTKYRRKNRQGECHSIEATERLEALIKNEVVRLTALNGSATGPSEPLPRGIAYKPGASWTDVGSVLLAEGHGLWYPDPKEWAWNAAYAKLAAQAAGHGVGLWDTDSCGAGPPPTSPLQLKVKWDAEGVDESNVNGEFVRITNPTASAVPLGGWWIRDAIARRYTLPAGAAVPAGGSILVRMGNGSSNASTYFWGQPHPVFQNVIGGGKAIGDGAYLFDPDGDLRASRVYPCFVGCAEPLTGKVDFTVHAADPESVRLANTSGGPIDLSEYEVESVPYFYEFARGTVLQPGQAITLVVKQRPEDDTQFVKGWGMNKFLFGDQRDVVTLRNPLGAPVVCAAWGGETCPSV